MINLALQCLQLSARMRTGASCTLRMDGYACISAGMHACASAHQVVRPANAAHALHLQCKANTLVSLTSKGTTVCTAEWQAVLMEVVTSIVRGLELECPTTCVYADLVGLVFCEPGSRYEPLVQEWQAGTCMPSPARCRTCYQLLSCCRTACLRRHGWTSFQFMSDALAHFHAMSLVWYTRPKKPVAEQHSEQVVHLCWPKDTRVPQVDKDTRYACHVIACAHVSFTVTPAGDLCGAYRYDCCIGDLVLFTCLASLPAFSTPDVACRIHSLCGQPTSAELCHACRGAIRWQPCSYCSPPSMLVVR